MSELPDIFASMPWLLAGCVFVLGLLVGSFLNVVIHRLPIMLERAWKSQAHELLGEATEASTFESTPAPAPEPYNLIVPRSRCPKCNAEITALQNIPVVSWLALGGKCANCRAPISARYPLVELITALLSAAVALHFGWHWQTLFTLIFTWALVALTVIDIDHTLLPDAITLPLLWLGLVLSVSWVPGLTPPAPVDPVSSIVGAAAGYLLLWSVYWAFKLATGKEGMGYGDFKLLAALGAWMGWQMLPLILLLSAFTGAIVGIALILLRGRDRNVPMPFGPYLAAAGWIALMWGPQITGGYLAFSGLGH
jgi:leader peptidase (prepilin peptidase)/N-methyltransferase